MLFDGVLRCAAERFEFIEEPFPYATHKQKAQNSARVLVWITWIHKFILIISENINRNMRIFGLGVAYTDVTNVKYFLENTWCFSFFFEKFYQNFPKLLTFNKCLVNIRFLVKLLKMTRCNLFPNLYVHSHLKSMIAPAIRQSNADSKTATVAAECSFWMSL